jgi:hypothetical protein
LNGFDCRFAVPLGLSRHVISLSTNEKEPRAK